MKIFEYIRTYADNCSEDKIITNLKISWNLALQCWYFIHWIGETVTSTSKLNILSSIRVYQKLVDFKFIYLDCNWLYRSIFVKSSQYSISIVIKLKLTLNCRKKPNIQGQYTVFRLSVIHSTKMRIIFIREESWFIYPKH